MKTIEKNEKLKRVDDITAEKLVRTENWKYVPKKSGKNKMS